MKGKIHSIETFGTVDGPGIRYLVFMQGCNLRCAYCHNPDTWDCLGGEERSIQEIIEDIKKYSRYIDGVTISGGEPLLQIDFVVKLCSEIKKLGLSTCVDTSGSIYNKDDTKLLQKMDKLMSVVDLFLLDIKHINEEKHRWLTGKSNQNILDFATYLSQKGKDVWLRYVLVPTINDDEESLMAWRIFADHLKNVKKIEILPYHKMAISKYDGLGIKYRLDGVEEPTQETIKKAESILLNKEKK